MSLSSDSDSDPLEWPLQSDRKNDFITVCIRSPDVPNSRVASRDASAANTSAAAATPANAPIMGDGMPFVDDDSTGNDAHARITGQSREQWEIRRGGVDREADSRGEGAVNGGGEGRVRPPEAEGVAGRGGGGREEEPQRYKVVINREAGGVVTLEDIRHQIPGAVQLYYKIGPHFHCLGRCETRRNGVAFEPPLCHGFNFDWLPPKGQSDPAWNGLYYVSLS